MKTTVATKRKVSLSPGNTKMGDIPSVSLPAVLTCRQCDCHTKCYAKRMEQRWKNVANAYKNNLEILREAPESYWRQVEASIMMSRFFRFHVSGDIPNPEYFEKMVEIAKRNPHCEILCFTKKYDIVNNYIRNNGWDKKIVGYRMCETFDLFDYEYVEQPVYEPVLKEDTAAGIALPSNLHIIFSGWVRLEMDNPFSLPEAHVRSKCGTTTARPGAINCPGNCTECATTDGGCWVLKPGQQVVFDEH